MARKRSTIKNWPAESVAMLSVDKLIPYARNARTHNDEQVAQIAASMQEWGWTNPILIDDEGGVIAGHGRILAARKLGYEKIPCMTASGWTEAQKRAYVIADNKLAMNADWDNDILSTELEELQGLGFDLELTGFSDIELNEYSTEETEGLTDPDDVPELEDETITTEGDIWILGNHRLLCGDSKDRKSVNNLMNGKKANFCFTSPPYNANTSIFIGSSNNSKIIKRGPLYMDKYMDNKTSADYIQSNIDIMTSVLSVADKNFICCYNLNYNKNSPSEYIDIIGEIKKMIPLKDTIIWEKTATMSLAGNNLTRIYEFIFVLCKGEYKINKVDTNMCIKNMWKINNTGSSNGTHHACFPVELVKEGIKNYCNKGDNIIEPYAGSGTVAIAAETMGLNAFMIEIYPMYCDSIIKRWQYFTGKNATLENDGRTFNEIQEELKNGRR